MSELEWGKYQFMVRDLFENFEIIQNENTLNSLKISFEKKEEEIFNSEWRKQNGFVAKGTRLRNIETPFGLICLKRRRYKYWDQDEEKYKYKCLVDDEIKIEKYQRYHPYFKIKILSYVADGKRYRDIIDIFKFANLTPSTISNIISRFDLNNWEKFLNDRYKKTYINKYLYILIDDTFAKVRINKNKSKYLKTRLVTFHTGRSKKYPRADRFSLDNKRTFYLMNDNLDEHNNTENLILKIYKLSKKFYSGISNAKIIVCGDGAPWIQQLANKMNAEFILDKFHSTREIWRTLYIKKNHYYLHIYKHTIRLLNSGQADELLKFLIKIKNIEKNIDQIKIQALIKYFKKRRDSIESYSKNWNIGCSAEAMISRMIKSPLKGNRCYSEKIFKILLNIRVAKVNGIDLLQILKEKVDNIFKVFKNKNHTNTFSKKIIKSYFYLNKISY